MTEKKNAGIPRPKDLDEGDEMSSRACCVKLPKDIDEFYQYPDERRKTALVRQVLTRAVREMPEWVELVEREIDAMEERVCSEKAAAAIRAHREAGLSYRLIAIELNRTGIPTNRGNMWSGNTVYQTAKRMGLGAKD